MTDVTDGGPRIYTLGHSSHPIERFVGLLERHSISRVVDVRSQPYSRWAPQFVRAALASALAARDIDYVFLGAALGGRPEGDAYRTGAGLLDVSRRAQAPDFQNGIERLLELAQSRTSVVLCAEEDPSRCHRRLLVTPALLQRGGTVWHLRGDGRVEAEDELAARGQLGLF